jgi:hypothetical protein
MSLEPSSPDEFSLFNVDDESLSSRTTSHPDKSSNSNKKSLTDKLRLAMNTASIYSPSDDQSQMITSFKPSESFNINNTLLNNTAAYGIVVSMKI